MIVLKVKILEGRTRVMTLLTTNIHMFYKKLVLAITFIGIVFIGAGVAQAAYITPPSTVGEAVVLIDADTKEILFAKNPDKWMHPASTTKMVTLLTALELKGTQLDELATISSYATSMEESNLGVRVGDQITLEGVLEGMMVASGNDAAVVVAENVSGSVDKFAKDMTRIAAKAGCRRSFPATCSGQSPAEWARCGGWCPSHGSKEPTPGPPAAFRPACP